MQIFMHRYICTTHWIKELFIYNDLSEISYSSNLQFTLAATEQLNMSECRLVCRLVGRCRSIGLKIGMRMGTCRFKPTLRHFPLLFVSSSSQERRKKGRRKRRESLVEKKLFRGNFVTFEKERRERKGRMMQE